MPHPLSHRGRGCWGIQLRAWSTGLGNHGYAPHDGHGCTLRNRVCRARPRCPQCLPRTLGWGGRKHSQDQRQRGGLEQLLQSQEQEAVDPGQAGNLGGAVATGPVGMRGYTAQGPVLTTLLGGGTRTPNGLPIVAYPMGWSLLALLETALSGSHGFAWCPISAVCIWNRWTSHRQAWEYAVLGQDEDFALPNQAPWLRPVASVTTLPSSSVQLLPTGALGRRTAPDASSSPIIIMVDSDEEGNDTDDGVLGALGTNHGVAPRGRERRAALRAADKTRHKPRVRIPICLRRPKARRPRNDFSSADRSRHEIVQPASASLNRPRHHCRTRGKAGAAGSHPRAAANNAESR